MKPKLYLIITNISKSNNIKSLLLSAAAYGADTVFVAGQRKFNFEVDDSTNTDVPKAEDTLSITTESETVMKPPRSDVPKQLHPLLKLGVLKIKRFDSLENCITYIRQIGKAKEGECGNNSVNPVQILGVEIVQDAKDVDSEPFDLEKDTAIMMGNEGSGMNTKQTYACDGFIRIAQYGGGTASLNVNVAANIVMHRFHIWARGNARETCQREEN